MLFSPPGEKGTRGDDGAQGIPGSQVSVLGYKSNLNVI